MIDRAAADETSRRRPELGRHLEVVYRGKWLGALVALLVIAATILVFPTIEFKFRATITVGPAQQETGLSRNLSGLASLAGVNLAHGQAVSPFALYLQMLHSHDVASAVQRDHATMIRLFPHRWDAASRTWHAPTGLVAGASRSFKDIVGMDAPRPAEPSVGEVQKLLEDQLNVVENRRDSLADISFANADPAFAAGFVFKISNTADGLLRTRGLDRANRFRNYLSQQLAIVQIAELRNSLAEALADQEKQRMIALSGLAFAAEPVGGITVSPTANEPKPIMVLASAAMASVALGVFAAYLRGRSRRVDV